MSSSVRTNSKSSLFLIELIVTLCFFSLASVVCVRLFIYAHKVSIESRRETLAIQISQNAAECFIAADGDPEESASAPSAAGSAETGSAEAGSAEAGGTLTGGALAGGAPTADEDGVMCRLMIRNTAADGSEIFSLEVLHYRQKGSSGESEAANEQ